MSESEKITQFMALEIIAAAAANGWSPKQCLDHSATFSLIIGAKMTFHMREQFFQ